VVVVLEQTQKVVPEEALMEEIVQVIQVQEEEELLQLRLVLLVLRVQVVWMQPLLPLQDQMVVVLVQLLVGGR
jgi:hypothetical protein